MSERQFNIAKACFWLVALVVIAHVIAALAAEAACIWYAADIVAGRFKCDADGRLTEVMAAALAAALAFAGSRMEFPKKPPVEPNPDDPDGV